MHWITSKRKGKQINITKATVQHIEIQLMKLVSVTQNTYYDAIYNRSLKSEKITTVTVLLTSLHSLPGENGFKHSCQMVFSSILLFWQPATS